MANFYANLASGVNVCAANDDDNGKVTDACEFASKGVSGNDAYAYYSIPIPHSLSTHTLFHYKTSYALRFSPTLLLKANQLIPFVTPSILYL